MTILRGSAVVCLLLGFGVVRQSVEERIEASLQANHFHEDNIMLDGPMREQLGQLGAAAALGGFRSFLATIYELRAVTAYFEVDYDAVESNYHLATQLQPREPGYWNIAAWMLDTNARRYYLSFDLKHSEKEREILARLSVERGKQFLEDGLRYNPEDELLHRSLGNHYAHRRGDFCRAAEAFGRAAEIAGEAGIAARHHALYLALCPDHEREAYAKLRVIAERIREGKAAIPSDLLPASLLLHLRYLEGVLDIPDHQRFPATFDFEALYNRLRAPWRPGMRYSALHHERLRRLEEILEIPHAQRIPSDEALAPW